jgi:hypothetical protein
MEAVRQLTKMGFSLQVVGDKIKYRYTGPGQPDRDRARRLLDDVAANKAEALAYLARQLAPLSPTVVPKPAPQPTRQAAHTQPAPAPPNAGGYMEKYPEGAAALKALGYWPFQPLTGPMGQTPAIPGEQPIDYRFDVERQEWVHDPGWWRRLPAAKVKH